MGVRLSNYVHQGTAGQLIVGDALDANDSPLLEF